MKGRKSDHIGIDVPLLEFDESRDEILKPGDHLKKVSVPDRCVFTFFGDVIRNFESRGLLKKATILFTESNEYPVYIYEVAGKEIVLFLSGEAAPLSVALLEELIHLGCDKFIVCGGAGCLDPDLEAGRIVVPVSAIRDEGTSFHYMPPGREISANIEGVRAVEKALAARNLEYTRGKTWTTDGIYRETKSKIISRRNEGCITVEMEASALFAAADFRKVTLAQILYAGDDVSGEIWDSRSWSSMTSVREKLVHLAAEAVLLL